MKRLVQFLSLSLAVATWAAPDVRAREFTVMAYNVEMLFDVDGVSLLDEYGPAHWGPTQLDHKLAAIAAVLQHVNDGRGPDIICFEELEADQTPGSTVPDLDGFLRKWSGKTVHELLTAPQLDPQLAGAPVQAWLAKSLADHGMAGYDVAVGRWRQDPTGHLVFHTNAVFSRFPINAARTHDTNGARGILEAQLDVGGKGPLYVFDNHWKSGAGDPVTEPVRIGNARVLRTRLDDILRADPEADVILAGDFNSQYNQKQRYPDMPRTAINDLLGSQGDETAMQQPRGPDLYNLWFELPNDRRGSDEFHGEWGTLMQILVTRGLYDARGVQYVDNSFSVAAFPGLNAMPDTGRPIRWTFADGGTGVSDHLPVMARFRVGSDVKPIRLEQPSRTATGPAEARRIAPDLDHVATLADWPAGKDFRTAQNLGRFFRVTGRVTSHHPFRAKVVGPGVVIDIWIYDRAARERFFAGHPVGDRLTFIGELGEYKGKWQFVIPDDMAE